MSEKLLAAIESLEQELAEHRAKVVETMTLINALHRRMGNAEPHKIESDDAKGRHATIGPDSFFDYGRPSDAAEALLEKLHRAMPIKEVVEALKRGGFKFSGKDHEGGLRTAIGKDGRFVRFSESDTVGLLDWYPKRKRAKSRSAEPEAETGADEK